MDPLPRETANPELSTKEVAPYLALWRLVMLEGLAYEPLEYRHTCDFHFICNMAGIPPAVARIITPMRAKRILRKLR